MPFSFRSLKEDLEHMFNNQKALQEEKSHFIVVNEDVFFSNWYKFNKNKIGSDQKNHRHKWWDFPKIII